MPPMLSDEESMSDGIDAVEAVPAKAPKKKSKAVAPPEPDPEQEDGSGDETGEDEYSVDAILEHRFEKGGAVKYKVKWLGYENEEDMTWEPAENLETAPEKLDEYHEKIGGKPTPASKGKKKGPQKRTASQALDSPVPNATKKRGRKSQTNGTETEESPFTLPKGSWEGDVSHVMSIVEEDELVGDNKHGKTEKVLMGFISWNNDHKTKHPLKTLKVKCPQHLLTYYENHLVFAKSEDVPAHLKADDDE